jgi:hypothetical protein
VVLGFPARNTQTNIWSIGELLTESGQIGSEKWICILHEPTVSPPIKILKTA